MYKGRKLQAIKLLFLFDGGAYSERAVPVSKAAAFDCTGSYAIKMYGVIHYVCIQTIRMQRIFGDLGVVCGAG